MVVIAIRQIGKKIDDEVAQEVIAGGGNFPPPAIFLLALSFFPL